MFGGRARRKEYWMFVLFNLIFGIVFGVVDRFIGIQIVSGIYSLAILIPVLALSIRRLHDLDKSGWWIFIILIPIAGAIWYLVLLCTEGTRGANQYGQDPKQESTPSGQGSNQAFN